MASPHYVVPFTRSPLEGTREKPGFLSVTTCVVVNGAQTVGAITQAGAKAPDCVARARVAVRLIALEDCPPEFDKQVTRYTNTQNRIDRRDFVALGIEQERIRGELQLEGISYIYKSGETQSTTTTGFDLVEATIARACLQPDAGYAVQAKREIGRLWDDIEKPPYKILFNPAVSGPPLWRAVQVIRQVDRSLQALRVAADGRERLLCVHGNRFATHLVLSRLPVGFITQHHALTEEEEGAIQELSRDVFARVLASLNELYPEAYLASLFKNATKCQALKTNVLASWPAAVV